MDQQQPWSLECSGSLLTLPCNFRLVVRFLRTAHLCVSSWAYGSYQQRMVGLNPVKLNHCHVQSWFNEQKDRQGSGACPQLGKLQ